MLYARRGADGRIEALFQAKPRGRSEAVATDHPEVLAFLTTAGSAAGGGAQDGTGRWRDDDLAMARVVEDLIDVLIQKQVITLTDLPLPAQRKLMGRHGRRDDWGYVARLYPTSAEDELG